jgi:hypothetical protein
MTTAQQFGMTLGNAATSEQAKSDHEGVPVAQTFGSRNRRRRTLI